MNFGHPSLTPSIWIQCLGHKV